MVKKRAEKFTGRKSKSVGEEGRKHHDLVGIRCRDVFPFRRSPLKHLTVEKKPIGDQFEGLTLVCSGLLKDLGKGGSHGAGKKT
jgi:hypothetical protein